jgi:hypothetical protein
MRKRHLASLLSPALLAGALGCSHHSPLAKPAAPLTPPTRWCGRQEGPPACRTTAQLESLLASADLVGMADTPSGMQGAKLLTLDAHGVVLRAKWRPQSSGDLINEPRKELAAYAVQKLFLDDVELVAPPTVARCFPLQSYRRFAPAEAATFPNTDCVFGFLSYWLEGVKTVGAARKADLLDDGTGIWDAERFEEDATYRGSVASANLLTYLINHGDAHEEQFVLEEAPRGLRAYVVDNSIAFRSIKNPMLLVRQDWSQIQVPWLPRAAVERLRRLTDADYERLGTVSELERREAQLVSIRATDAKSDGTALSWDRERLRLGLTPGEIELVRTRAGELLKRPDLATLSSEPSKPAK